MTETITRYLNDVFQKAALSNARKTLTAIDDLEKLSDINRNALEERDHLIRRYHDEYEARVDVERQRRHQTASQVKRDHPAPAGAPVTDIDTITLQAHEHVRRAHDADLRGAADETERQIEALLQGATQRNQAQGLTTDAFLRAGDRRSGQDRHIPQQSRN